MPLRTLVLTRPEEQSQTFLKDCETALGRTISTIISPVLRIRRTEADVALDDYRTIIVTSQNALQERDLSGRCVVTVGSQTAERARQLGADATCLGACVDEFVTNGARVQGPAIYLRGQHTRGDLVERMADIGVRVDEVTVYMQEEQTLTPQAKDALEQGRAVVPVFSPRSAALVSAYATHPDTTIVAISAAAADAWFGEGRVITAQRPDKDAMCDSVLAAL
ncbi:MAG: uroporphyrinogen-III synthase [Pseudomonadota bacterium]